MTIKVPPDSTSTPVVFQGRASANQTLTAANTWYKIALDLEDRDDDNGHSTTTNNSRWTAARAAPYLLSGTVHFYAGAAAGARQVCLYRNNVQIAGTPASIYPNTGFFTTVHTVPIYLDLAVGDYIELAAQADNANTTAASNSLGYFSMLRVQLAR